MGQAIVLKKFQLFLNLMEPIWLQQLEIDLKKNPENDENKIRKLQEKMRENLNRVRTALDSGHCFSLALIHGAMDKLGKLAWWEKALVEIATWNGAVEKLAEQINLPDAEEAAFWQTEEEKIKNETLDPTEYKKQITLKTILERALSYVVYHQALPDANLFDDANQAVFLDPQNSFFEMLDNNQIQYIKKRKIVAGYFDQSELDKLLNEDDFTDTIGLIHSTIHTIRVGFKNGKWFIYNSNNDHTVLSKLSEYFDNKSDLIKKIINICPDLSLAIELVSSDSSKNISSFDSSYEANIKKLEECGLHILARYTPDTLLKILDIADTTVKGRQKVIEAFIKRDPYENWTGLHMVARYVPGALSKILDIVDKVNNGHAIIAQVLAMQSDKGWTGLHMLARYAPDVLPRILDTATQTVEECQKIISALIQPNCDGWTGLHMVARNAPEMLSRILDIALKTPEGSEKIVKALTIQNTDGYSTFHMFVRYAPDVDVFSKLLDVVDKANGHAVIAQVLAMQSNDGWSILDMIANNMPSMLPKVLELVAKSPDGASAIANALMKNDQYNNPGFQMLLKKMPQAFIPIIIQYAPHLLSTILDMLPAIPNGNNLLAAAIESKNKDGITGLQAIVKCKQTRSLLTRVLECASVQSLNNNVHPSQTQLSYAEFIKAVNSYSMGKNITLFSRRWSFSSNEKDLFRSKAFEKILEMNKASDEKRFEIANQYLDSNEDFSKALDEVMTNKRKL